VNPVSLTTFVSDFTGLQALLASHQPLDLALDALDFTLAMASCEWRWCQVRYSPELTSFLSRIDTPFFRLLLMLPMDEDIRDPKRPPMVELLCGYLRNKHPGANEATVGHVLTSQSGILGLRSLFVIFPDRPAASPDTMHLFHHVHHRKGCIDTTRRQLLSASNSDLLPRGPVREDLGCGGQSGDYREVSGLHEWVEVYLAEDYAL